MVSAQTRVCSQCKLPSLAALLERQHKNRPPRSRQKLSRRTYPRRGADGRVERPGHEGRGGAEGESEDDSSAHCSTSVVVRICSRMRIELESYVCQALAISRDGMGDDATKNTIGTNATRAPSRPRLGTPKVPHEPVSGLDSCETSRAVGGSPDPFSRDVRESHRRHPPSSPPSSIVVPRAVGSGEQTTPRSHVRVEIPLLL